MKLDWDSNSISEDQTQRKIGIGLGIGIGITIPTSNSVPNRALTTISLAFGKTPPVWVQLKHTIVPC